MFSEVLFSEVLLFREEVVTALVGDCDLSKIADGELERNEDATIDIRGIPHTACDSFFLHEDLDRFSHLLIVDLLSDSVDGTGELSVALLDGHVVGVTGVLVGPRAFLFGVLENAAAFELEAVDKGQKFLVIGLCFVRETSNESGANGEVGDAITHALQKVADILSVGFAVHELEHVVADMLKRDVNVTGHLFAFGDGANEFVGPMGGVGVENSNPEIAFESVEGSQEGCQ